MLSSILADGEVAKRIECWQVVDGGDCHPEGAGDEFVVRCGAEIFVRAAVFHLDGDQRITPAIGDWGKAKCTGGIWGVVVNAGICDHNCVVAGRRDPQWLIFVGAGRDTGQGNAAFTGVFGDGQVIKYVQRRSRQQVAVLQPLNLATAIPGALFPG